MKWLTGGLGRRTLSAASSTKGDLMVGRLVGAVLVGLVLTGCGASSGSEEAGDGASATAAGPTELELAADACGGKSVGNPLLTGGDKEPAAKYLRVEDDGTTLIVDGRGAVDAYGATQAGFCVLKELHVPASTRSLVGSTTGLMGRQSDEWDGYEATWSYHADSGLDMIIEHVTG